MARKATLVRVTLRHEIEATVDADKFIAVFSEEWREFGGTKAEFVAESADAMGRDIIEDADGWLVGGIAEDAECQTFMLYSPRPPSTQAARKERA